MLLIFPPDFPKCAVIFPPRPYSALGTLLARIIHAVRTRKWAREHCVRDNCERKVEPRCMDAWMPGCFGRGRCSSPPSLNDQRIALPSDGPNLSEAATSTSVCTIRTPSASTNPSLFLPGPGRRRSRAIPSRGQRPALNRSSLHLRTLGRPSCLG